MMKADVVGCSAFSWCSSFSSTSSAFVRLGKDASGDRRKDIFATTEFAHCSSNGGLMLKKRRRLFFDTIYPTGKVIALAAAAAAEGKGTSNSNSSSGCSSIRGRGRRRIKGGTVIEVGERLPEARLSYIDEGGDLRMVEVSDLTRGRRVVVVGVPGAFTPVCTLQHLPPFLRKAAQLRSRGGVDLIACVAVNDVFVMRAWGRAIGLRGELMLLSDGNAKFTRGMGLGVDLGPWAGLGLRSRRYSLLAHDGVVQLLNLEDQEDGGFLSVSGADHILRQLTSPPNSS